MYMQKILIERNIMSWFYLGIAVIFEVAVGILASKAQGFARLWWTVGTLVSGAIATLSSASLC